MKNQSAIRIRILICTLALLILAQGFNGSLSISAFEKLYLNSLISSYQVVGKDIQRNIQSAVRFGKPIKKFFGITKLFEEINANMPDLDNVDVTLPDGKVLYSLKKKSSNTSIPMDIFVDFAKIDPKDTINLTGKTILHDGVYYIIMPVRDRTDTWLGSVYLSFEEKLIKKKIRVIIFYNLKILGLSTIVAAILLMLALSFFTSFEPGKFKKLQVYIILMVILIGSQLCYSVFNVAFFKNNYIKITRDKSEQLTRLLKDDIDFLFSKGIRIDRLFKVDVLMSEIISATPEIEDMRLLNKKDKTLYLANHDGVVKISKLKDKSSVESVKPEETIYNIILPLMKKGKVEGRLMIRLSEDAIGTKIKEIILDSVTVVVISLLFIVELLLFLFIYIQKQIDSMSNKVSKTTTISSAGAYNIMRPAAFLYLFAMDLSVSFLPLHMGKLYQPMFGLSKDMVMGLPISAEMLFAGIALIVAGVWMERRGWQFPFIVGVIVSSAGSLMSGLATGPMEFIAYRGFTGFGYGLTWMAAQGFIFNTTTISTRARGLSSLIAGIYAGSICGGAVGGMIAERMGYAPVFIVAMGIILLNLPFVLLFMREYFEKPDAVDEDGKPVREVVEKEEKIGLMRYIKYMFSRNIFSLLVLSSMPAGFVLVAFVYYISPIYLYRIGTAQSNIGRALMVYGIFMIYFAPLVSRFVDGAKSKKPFIAISGILGGIGLLAFHFITGFAGTVLAIFMLSLSSAFGFASQSVFVLNLKETKEIGVGNAMGVYRAVERVGQVLGPIVAGLIIFTITTAMGYTYENGIEVGVTLLGGSYVFLTILFLIISKEEDPAESA